MVGMGQVKDGITQKNHQFFMISLECSGQRAVMGLHYHAVSHPLPKLRLGGPKLFTVAANNQRGLFLFLLLFVFACTHFVRFESIHFCPGMFRAYESNAGITRYPEGKPLKRGGV